MPRARKDPRTGKFVTAERTTTTVTERLTVEDAGPVTHPPPPVAGRPLRVYGFASLLTSPPEDAQWAHPAFIADMAARAAVLPFADHTNPYPDRARRSRRQPEQSSLPVIEVPRVPYPPLAEDTLAHEFTLTGPLDMLP